MRKTRYGLVPDGDGWFVLNARETRWLDTGPLGHYCNFEGKRPFPQLGMNLNVLRPGDRMAMYHRENAQEGFLVLTGRCVLVVEEHERELRAWDFFHCPPGTAHVIVGAGDTPAVVVAIGARRIRPKGIVYPVSAVASAHGAGAMRETTHSSDAYAGLPRWQRVEYADGLLPGA